MDDTSGIALTQYTVQSDVLANARSVWLQAPATTGAEPGLVVFLDGEYFLGHLGAPATMVALQRDRALPPTWSVYVASRERTVRWPESFCNPDFVSFVCDELLPQLEAKTGAARDRSLAGLSLTGLSAAHVALSRPEIFSRVLCLSASFWWENARLAEQVPGFPRSDTAFRITVGSEESATDVDHGHGLIQALSQIDGVNKTRDALVACGFPVSYNVFEGGHDVPSWRRELAADLRALWALEPGVSEVCAQTP